jgi:hypothetical protein
VAPTPQMTLPNASEPVAAAAPAAFWVGVAAVALAVFSILATIVNEIAARWRGIVIAHLFFLTLWMAIQVFFFATGAYWCLPSNGSMIADWFSRYFHIARCGAVSRGPTVFDGSAGAAAAAPVPRPPAGIPAPAPLRVPSAAAAPPPASAPSAAPAFGAGSNWSSRGIANCWRNRSVDGGDCYETADPRRNPPPAVRYYRYRDPPPPRPCRRPYDCWPDDYFPPDDL